MKTTKKTLHIDQLPEEIKLHIASFLPQKDLTQASLISKSWRKLILDNQI